MGRFLFAIVAVVVLLIAGFVGYKYYFVFSRGVKAGTLNYFEEKGYVFKTYEGRLIQSGYRSKTPGAIQSNEFRFSVSDQRVAEQLMRGSGQFVELHYKQYLGALPWRGFSAYIVDSVLSAKDPAY